MKKLIVLISVLVFTHQLYSMKVTRQECSYPELLPEIKELVVFACAESKALESAVEDLRHLTLTDKIFYSKVNHPIIMRGLINAMAQRFDVPSEYAAKKLSTVGSKNYIDLSYELINSLWKHDFTQAETLVHVGADIDFQAADYYPITSRPNNLEKMCPKGLAIYYSVGDQETCIMSSCFSLVMYAIAGNKYDVLTWLIKHDANLNISMGNGDTALLMAINLGEKDIAQLLIQSGASINQKNKLKVNDEEIYDIISSIDVRQTKMTMTSNFLASLLAPEQKKRIMRLVFSMSDVLLKLGETPLIRLIYESYTFSNDDFDTLVTLLLARGVDLNIQDDHGSTALIALAHMYGKAETMKLLLDRGADPIIEDDENFTALDRMHEGRSAGDPERKEKRALLEEAMQKLQQK